jgi:hypothetical protein
MKKKKKPINTVEQLRYPRFSQLTRAGMAGALALTIGACDVVDAKDPIDTDSQPVYLDTVADTASTDEMVDTGTVVEDTAQKTDSAVMDTALDTDGTDVDTEVELWDTGVIVGIIE